MISNDYVEKLNQTYSTGDKKIFYGAPVKSNRLDALDEIGRVSAEVAP